MINVDHRFGEGLWRLLRKIVANAAFDRSVFILACEFLCIRTGFSMRRTIGVTFKSNGRNSDDRTFG